MKIYHRDEFLLRTGIYRHYKGGLYKVLGVSFNCDDQKQINVIYQKSDEHGLYISVRNEDGSPATYQPFHRDIKEFLGNVIAQGVFTKRFILIEESNVLLNDFS